MIIKRYPKEYIFNQEMLGENRLPARTLLLPAQKRDITYKNYTESDHIKLLSGDWKFRYLHEDTDEQFYLPESDDSNWDILPVPSMWQFYGYGSCFYPNLRYCFPYDPPYIHCNNPVGLYRKAFTAEKNEKRVILRFLGVDNAYFVWLNGNYVGFSKGSRIPAEFDVTDALQDGVNLLAVKVYTFSDASYLEGQDMLLASGIFRDAMLVYTEPTSLWDEVILPDRDGFTIKYMCSDEDPHTLLKFTLCDKLGNICSEKEMPSVMSGLVFLPLFNTVLWNAEQPYLYTLYTEVIKDGETKEIYTKKAGIAKSEIIDCSLLMNGTPITLKGVNRHENNSKTGRAISAEQIRTELLDIKENNLNAIRASHYTNHPLFYELCSEIGIYVMDEADCETHGAECTGDLGALNKDKNWFDAFFDRVSRMYAINKNETCINIWSLGNECGHGENNDRCVSWLLEQDVKKPVKDNNNSMVDPDGGYFETTGYMPMQKLYEMAADARRPLMMLEYAHAMGNSPGGLEDIWNWVYENEVCCGGYVWEYKSHGFYTEGKDGKPRYLYGGDFPDKYHWSNFSLDGYHTSDGNPKPSWRELKEVSAPVYVRWKKDGIDIKNTNDFKSLNNMKLYWTIRNDGLTMCEGEQVIDSLAARQWKRISLPFEKAVSEGIVTADCVFSVDGKEIAHKQKILYDLPHSQTVKEPYNHNIVEKCNNITVNGDDFSVTFSDGILCKLIKNNDTIIDAPMKINLMRAPTDNDGIVGFSPRLIDEWNGYLLNSIMFGCHNTSFEESPESVIVYASGKILPYSHYWGFEGIISYRVFAHGEIEVSFDMKPYGRKLPSVLPRIGVVFELDGSFKNCKWLGRGPEESYQDCKAHTFIGIHESEVSKMYFRYDVPQETGNHEDCRLLTVSGKGGALTVSGKFSFSLHDFTLENLAAARHCDELIQSEKNFLYIDYKHRGLGSNSCGPQPEEQYELKAEPFRWHFLLKA